MESIILSSWDHILGPQIEKLWHIKDCSSQELFIVPDKILQDFNVNKNCKSIQSEYISISTLKTYTVMCGQLLLGEVDSYRTVDEWSSRLYVSEDYILLAVLFHMNSWKCSIKDVCLCFGIVFKSHSYNLILYNHLLIDLHLRKTVNSLKNSQFSVDSCLKNVTALVKDVTTLIDSITRFSLSHLIQEYFKIHIMYDIIPQAIVSHLQTSGYTAVVGTSRFVIDEVIYLLSLFSPKRKPSRSSHVLATTCMFSKSYILGLCCNNIKDIERSSKFLIERANKEICPLTVVDLESKKIWQTIPFQESSKTEKNSLCLINEHGCLVPELVKDLIFIQDNKGDYRCFIENFKEGLMMKSCALIKAVEHLRSSGKFSLKREIMEILAIKNFVDLEVLLGCAENIKPGIRSSIIE